MTVLKSKNRPLVGQEPRSPCHPRDSGRKHGAGRCFVTAADAEGGSRGPAPRAQRTGSPPPGGSAGQRGLGVSGMASGRPASTLAGTAAFRTPPGPGSAGAPAAPTAAGQTPPGDQRPHGWGDGAHCRCLSHQNTKRLQSFLPTSKSPRDELFMCLESVLPNTFKNKLGFPPKTGL